MSAYGAQQMAAAFRTVRSNTVRIAEEIPEDKYDWAPAAGTKTVQALLAHIAISPSLQEDMHRVRRVTTLQGYDFGAVVGKMSNEESKPRSKGEIIQLLVADGASFANWLESLSADFLAETYTDPTGQNPKTRLEGLLSAKEHEMHHRGQLMLMERILGIVPHLTRQMQERIAARAAAVAG
ncbi:MAG: DinB family protein [Gemmatimonadaceae bacterium]